MRKTETACRARRDAENHIRPNYKQLLLAGIAVSLALSPALGAQPMQEPEQVLITGRPPDPVGANAFSTTRLAPKELQVYTQVDLALRQVPGLSLFRRNSSLSANPSVQGVSLRSIAGSAAGRALVTLDGVPQNDPFGGWVIWSSLPAEILSGAQVVRGAGAGPYGSGALTGVISLYEREGAYAAGDVAAGDYGQGRVSLAGGIETGKTTLSGSAMYQESDGWVPISDAQRGAADSRVSLKASSYSARVSSEIVPGTLLVARLATYEELRNSGIVGTRSRAVGTNGSVTLAHPEQTGSLGWRMQMWFRESDLANSSAAIGAGRATTTPSNDQYATPALGWGGNAAVRGTSDIIDWEVGVDARVNDGESREFFTWNASSGRFTNHRRAGGKSLVAGAYVEGASRFDGWLITAGGRLDYWENADGFTRQNVVATGAVTVNQILPSNFGWLPNGRVGVRKDIMEDLYLRVAAYNGFRQASLNELYRHFRLGNNFTLANAGLRPEKLYGAEIGAGDDDGDLTWSVTGFYNQLKDAITNVTIGAGPGTFPVAGFLPAGGLLIQRQNVGHIDAFGVEGLAQYAFSPDLALRAAFAFTDARVEGGATAPALTGKRPLQTPRWTVTGGIVASPIDRVTLEGYLRFESMRFADDLNTLVLPNATIVDFRARYNINDNINAYVAVDNVFDMRAASTKTADGIVTLDAPRMFRLGVSFAY
jgi:vitamin B12 transporter